MGMISGYYFFIPIFVWFIVQILKGVVDIFRDECGSGRGLSYILKNCRSFEWIKKNLIKLFTSSGGFPSGHSALSASVLCLIGLVDGIKSPLFMLAFVFSFLWRYDAMHVRYQTGQHAKMLNHLQEYFAKNKELHLTNTKKFRERVGHTLGEVIGGIVIGACLTFVFYYWLFL